MVKLRLRRMGRKKRPLYALVATDSRMPRDGRFIEDLGRYEPLQEPAAVDLKTDRILYWLQTGAQPSETVRSILSREGVMLALHMTRKGADAEAIAAAVEAHREAVQAKKGKGKMTAKDRKAAMLVKEAEEAAKRDAELAAVRAEAEAKAKAAAEAAQKQAAEERAKAAEEARKAQEAANAEAGQEPTSEEAPAAKAAVKEEAPAAKASSKEEAPAAAAKDEAPAQDAPADAEAEAAVEEDKK